MIASTQALVDAVTALNHHLHYTHLPPSLYVPPPIDRRDDIPESELPPRKRSCLSTLGPREVGYGIRDTWVDSAKAVLEIAPITMGEVDLLIEDRIAHQETRLIVEEKAYASREAWAHSVGLSQAVHYELQTHREQVYAHESQIQAHQTQLQLQGTLIQTQHQAELLALREQQRRARQPGTRNVRVPISRMLLGKWKSTSMGLFILLL
ncbi:hypothetical protein Tco_0137880 [Tanacetum coccineum]